MQIREDEFYGFGVDADSKTAAVIIDYLYRKASDCIYKNDTGAEVVEEIIRRGGEFFDNIETRQLAPWETKYNDICSARFRYRNGEKRSPNPGYAAQDWVILSIPQFQYGLYLQKKIAEGTLTKADLIIKNPARIRVTN